MEGNHITSFEISGFKKITDLKIENIGQFNLIVGDNNVGKTTLLESLLINKDYQIFLDGLSGIMFFIKKFKGLTNSFFSYSFSDNNSSFPQIMNFKLTKKNAQYDIIRFHRRNLHDFTFQYSANSEITDKIPLTGVPTDNIEKGSDFNFNIPYIPFGALYSHELTRQYSNNIQLFVDKKEKMIESLSNIISGIKNIEVNASYSHEPILLISEKGKNKLAPLATYGDGTIKLFRILLSLFANEHYDRLMIDELDAGVHYSRLKDFIKSLILVAKEQKKQIFATTHSKECIEYFTLALKELEFEQAGRIIRLAETKSGIKAYTNIYEQFENSLSADSEIR